MWTFFVNNERVSVDPAVWGPETTLLEYLRRGLGLTGAKLGCGEGGCGACTVMVSGLDVGGSGELVHRSVNACLAPLCSVESMVVTTVEGIGSTRAGPHPVQERIAKFHGSQCGFCTPGIVMSLYTSLRNNSKPTMAELEEVFDGNLCRCTGYRPIIDAARSFATDRSSCCRSGGSSSSSAAAAAATAGDGPQGPSVALSPATVVVSSSQTKACASLGSDASGVEGTIERCTQTFDPDATAPAMPAGLDAPSAPLRIEGATTRWERPTSELALLRILAAEPTARIVAGNTEVGIETKFKHVVCPIRVATSAIETLSAMSLSDRAMTIGGAVTLSALEHFLDAEICASMVAPRALRAAEQDQEPQRLTKETPHFSMRGAVAMRNMLRWFASTQIRNVATLAGNVATASPISDMNPVLLALDATIILGSLTEPAESDHHDGDGSRSSSGAVPVVTERVVAVREFFIGYRKTAMRPGEAILRIVVPLTTEFEFVESFKQARRRDDDISIVTSCMKIAFEVAAPTSKKETPRNWNVIGASLAFGGMAATSFCATETEAMLTGRAWTQSLWREGTDVLQASLALPPNVIGGMSAFRTTLAVSFFYKFCVATNLALRNVREEVREERETLGLLANKRSNPAALVVPPPVTLNKREWSGATTFVAAPRPATFGAQSYPMFNAGGIQHGGAKKGATDHDSVDADAVAAVAAAAATRSSPAAGAMPPPLPSPDVSLLAHRAPVGQPYAHRSATMQCTGEAVYVDDMPDPSAKTLHAALVLAKLPHARIVSIDASAAIALSGAGARGDRVSFFSAADLSEDANTMGAVLLDEQLFRSHIVTSAGQPLGVVVAESEALAKRGARLVEVELAALPPVVSIEEARAKKRFHPVRHEINCGTAAYAAAEVLRKRADPTAADGIAPSAAATKTKTKTKRGTDEEEADCASDQMNGAFEMYRDAAKTVLVVEGEVRIGGQEHFYLECNAAIAVPGEGDELVIFASTQNPTKTQKFAARACGGIPASKVVCRVKRMGGGFGGKETRSVFVSSVAAFCAHRLRQPVRTAYTKFLLYCISDTFSCCASHNTSILSYLSPLLFSTCYRYG